MSKLRKITAVAAPAIMALAIAAPSEAKILLMGEGGWEVSFDGSVNSFYNFVTKEEMQGAAGFTTHAGAGAGNDSSRVTVGLLPAVWGMNVKAPTTGGIDMGARVMMGISTQNNRRKNTGNAASGGQNGANLDLREIHFTASGASGSVLVGRTLGIYQGTNIAKDMTLFGVGWNAGEGAGGGTTLGRIGAGYVYPNFNTGIRYSTPAGSAVGFQVGIFDPSTLGGGGGVSETPYPRLELEFSGGGSVQGVSMSAWANGMFQYAQRSTADIQTACGDSANGERLGIAAAPNSESGCSVAEDVFVGGGAYGVEVGIGGLKLTGAGYHGRGLGMAVMLDNDAIDEKGHPRNHYGYYAQGTFALGNGTNVGVSWGESRADESGTDFVQRASVQVRQERVTLTDVMVWHNINDNLRFVAEYGHQEVGWHDGATQEAEIVSLGGFFFW